MTSRLPSSPTLLISGLLPAAHAWLPGTFPSAGHTLAQQKIAWKAGTAAAPPQNRKGHAPLQRFFIGMAQRAGVNERPEPLRVHAVTHPHSPGKDRVDGLVAIFKEFEQAFACRPVQPEARFKRCRVW